MSEVARRKLRARRRLAHWQLGRDARKDLDRLIADRRVPAVERMLGKELYYNRDGKPVSWEKGMRMFRSPEYRVVCQEMVASRWLVSTVLLMINHNFSLTGPPVIFETMVFDHFHGHHHAMDEYTRRYCTIQTACMQHDQVVDEVKELLQ